MSFVALGGLLLLCSLLGWAWRPLWSTSGDTRAQRLVFCAVTGWVGVAALLVALSVLGVPWQWWTLAPALLALLMAPLWWQRRRGWRSPPAAATHPLGWGDGLAVIALLLVVVLAARGELLFPDFVFHWGLKTQKFALAHGVDWAYLSNPWDPNHQRPEYPHLLPSLGAATTLLGGRFHAAAAGMWSIAALVLTVVAVRGALGRAGVSGTTLQAGVAWAGFALGMFALPFQLAGSVDPFLALALVMALPALMVPAQSTQPGHDVQLGVAAALAAAAKIEGVALAGILLAVHVARRGWADRRQGLAALVRSGIPIALVLVPWLWGLRRIAVESAVHGRLDLTRLPVVLGALAETLFSSDWVGMAVLILLAPALLARREMAAVAAVVVLQAGLYLYVYLSAPSEPHIYIHSTAARLALHLLPAVGCALMIASARGATPASSSDPNANVPSR